MKRLFPSALCLAAIITLTGCGTAVPDLRGMTADQATKAIESAGFRVGQITYDEDAQGAVGAVIAQDPEAGKRAKEGSLMVFTVAGPPPVKTPDLTGLDLEKATAALMAAGLSVGEVVESYDASTTAGLLVSQEPAAGSEAPDGSTVAMVISKGPEPVAVPKVKGKTEAEAKKALVSAGFKVKVEKKANKAKKGVVITQNPADGKTQPGSTVSITISTGVEMVKVPNVVGTFWGDAGGVGILESRGFKVLSKLVLPEDSPHFGQPNTIVDQVPSAGALLPKGATVRIIAASWRGESEW